MPYMQIPVSVVVADADGDDSIQYDILIDQREFAAAEAADLPADTEKPVLRSRFMAWHAMKRLGHTKLAQPAFERNLIAAWQTGPSTGGDALDPTQKDQSNTA